MTLVLYTSAQRRFIGSHAASAPKHATTNTASACEPSRQSAIGHASTAAANNARPNTSTRARRRHDRANRPAIDATHTIAHANGASARPTATAAAIPKYGTSFRTQ